MKRLTIAAAAALFAILLTGCMKTAVVTPPVNPSPNQGLIDAADAVQIACEVGAPLAGSIGPLITEICPPFVAGMLDIIESNGTVATLNALVATLKSEVAAVPGASTNKVIEEMLAAAQGIVAIYETATGQTVTPAAYQRADLILVGAHKIHLTSAEKARIKAIRARAAKLAAKK